MDAAVDSAGVASVDPAKQAAPKRQRETEVDATATDGADSHAEPYQPRRKRYKTKLGSGGPKENVNDGSVRISEEVTRAFEAFEKNLRAPRLINNRGLSVAVWDASRRLAVVQVQRGKSLVAAGHSVDGMNVLLPEEALFLLEKNTLAVLRESDGVPMSVQEAFATIFPTELGVSKYAVYAHLKRFGYVVLRFDAERGRTVQTQATLPSDAGTVAHVAGSVDPATAGAEVHAHGISTLIEHPCELDSLSGGLGISCAEALKRLRVINAQSLSTLQLQGAPTERADAIDFDIYKPNAAFKKTNPGPPAYRLKVYSRADAFPSLQCLHLLTQQCNGAPLKLAVVDGLTVSFYSLDALPIIVLAAHPP